MQIFCTACERPVPAANVDLSRNVAKCEACNEIFDCTEQLARVARQKPRQELPLPKGLRVFRRPNGIRIVRKWFHPAILALLVFCCFWDGFLIFWYSIAIRQRQVIMMIFPILHVAVGVGLTYFVVASFVNKTVITILHGRLEIKHGPIPYPGKTLEADAIDRLDCRTNRNRNNNGETYALMALMKDGRKVKLLSASDRDQLLYIEQEMEKHMGIGGN